MKKQDNVYMIETFKDGKIETTIKKATKDTFKVAQYKIIAYDKWDSKEDFLRDFRNFIEWLYWENEKTDVRLDKIYNKVSVVFTDKPYYER